MINSKEAYLYFWFDKIQDWNFWKSINPVSTTKLYLYERKQIQDPKKINQLKKEIFRQQPSVIIAHSLGCHYLMNYINGQDLPSSVKNIYLINSETPYNFEITNPDLIKKLESDTLKIDNYFFSWDFTLMSSTLFTGVICSGIIGFSSPYINNHFKFIPSFGNWHTSLLESKWIKENLLHNKN